MHAAGPYKTFFTDYKSTLNCQIHIYAAGFWRKFFSVLQKFKEGAKFAFVCSAYKLYLYVSLLPCSVNEQWTFAICTGAFKYSVRYFI
jgi:hypothetical protein